ncbi:MAG: AraC family transcriptional regulator [Succinivibrio sp.]
MDKRISELKELVLRNTVGIGNFETSVKGLRFIRRDRTTDFIKCFYAPCCMLMLQGRKQIIFGIEELNCAKGQYVLSSTDVPVDSSIVEATPDEPLLAVVIEFDVNAIFNLLLESRLPKNSMQSETTYGVADADPDLLDSFLRLSRLVEKSDSERDVMGEIILKEIYFRLLTGPLGSQLRLINTKGTPSNQIAQAISIIKVRYGEKLSMDDLAGQVNMAPSSFYRNFKKMTQVSPLQYQKRLRLIEAQRLMLTGAYNAESACYKVGYESPTQFSREYKKMFGNPPRTDVRLAETFLGKLA